jgi:glycosyltransferase 2 family protein
LHEHQISHRSLSAEHLLRDESGAIWILGHSGGSVAASDVSRRIDVAELLCTLATLTTVERAVSSGRRVLGPEALARALPVLQPVALSPATRRAVRKHKNIMVSLRDALTELKPDGELEQINIERIKPRTLIMIVIGTIAAYVLLTQLASIDVPTLFANANWWWLVLAVGLTVFTFVASAWSLSGFVPEQLKLHRTVLAQLAGAFSTLVSPPTLGAVAINMRFLTKSGLHPALAAASVGVSQVVAFVVHILLIIGFGIAAGTQTDLTFNPPRALVIAIAAALVIAIALFAVPIVRRPVTKRVRPLLKEVVPRLVTVAQRPAKLIEGIGGMLILNLAFIGVLWACVRAFDGSLPIAVIAVVYLAGATLGQAAPTPGGIGAVEAALAAGLTAGGLDGGLAVSSVLLFRLITFWIPTIPGYWSFTWLQRKGAL